VLIYKWIILCSVYNVDLWIRICSTLTVSQIYKEEYILLVGKRCMHLTTLYTMPKMWERNRQVVYELCVEAEERVGHRADLVHLAQSDGNMNILATRRTVGLCLVSPLITSYICHNLIATVSITAVGYKLLYLTPFLLIDFFIFGTLHV